MARLKKAKWRVVQGSSRAIVAANSYYEAVARAAQIGFTRPTSIVLYERGGKKTGIKR